MFKEKLKMEIRNETLTNKQQEVWELAKEFANSYKEEISKQLRDFYSGGKIRQIAEFKTRNKNGKN
jgi:hypothetical protein